MGCQKVVAELAFITKRHALKQSSIFSRFSFVKPCPGIISNLTYCLLSSYDLFLCVCISQKTFTQKQSMISESLYTPASVTHWSQRTGVSWRSLIRRFNSISSLIRRNFLKNFPSGEARSKQISRKILQGFS